MLRWTAMMVFVFAIALAALAADQTGPQADTGKMSMGDMMTRCMSNCQAVSKSIDETSRTIDEAKGSNDPAKMRAALDRAQQQLAQMKEHMSGCTSMMKRMQDDMMHGQENKP